MFLEKCMHCVEIVLQKCKIPSKLNINYTDMLSRKLDNFIERHYANNKSVLLLKGARQVGENTGFIVKFRQLNHTAGRIGATWNCFLSQRLFIRFTNQVRWLIT